MDDKYDNGVIVVKSIMIGKFRQNLAYSGLPFILVMLIVLHDGQIDELVLLLQMLLAVFGYLAAVQDIKTKRIPNKLIIAMLGSWGVVGVLLLFFETSRVVTLLLDSVIGFVVGGGLFMLVYLVSRKGIGGGDVKFMAAAGLYLGLYGIVPAIFYGSVIAALTGLMLLLLKKIKRKDTMPLVPFLYIGILTTVFLS